MTCIIIVVNYYMAINLFNRWCNVIIVVGMDCKIHDCTRYCLLCQTHTHTHTHTHTQTHTHTHTQPTLLGSELLDMAASHMKVKEKEYFGLYTDGDGLVITSNGVMCVLCVCVCVCVVWV